jgi:prolyl oligopeptidase
VILLRHRSLYSYGLSQSGSDWCYARCRRVATGEEYPETLRWLKFTRLNFTHDNKGGFYQRFPEPVGVDDAGTETGINSNAMVRSHLKSTDESYTITFLERSSLRIS